MRCNFFNNANRTYSLTLLFSHIFFLIVFKYENAATRCLFPKGKWFGLGFGCLASALHILILTCTIYFVLYTVYTQRNTTKDVFRLNTTVTTF